MIKIHVIRRLLKKKIKAKQTNMSYVRIITKEQLKTNKEKHLLAL